MSSQEQTPPPVVLKICKVYLQDIGIIDHDGEAALGLRLSFDFANSQHRNLTKLFLKVEFSASTNNPTRIKTMYPYKSSKNWNNARHEGDAAIAYPCKFEDLFGSHSDEWFAPQRGGFLPMGIHSRKATWVLEGEQLMDWSGFSIVVETRNKDFDINVEVRAKSHSESGIMSFLGIHKEVAKATPPLSSGHEWPEDWPDAKDVANWKTTKDAAEKWSAKV
ncbi:hypothetical protein BT69DRAFT_1352218 [Atractiella rhizophila]|nr:hypothetical protein BT69DRAFT_1352218 [Atractiella rhizophila]